MMGSTVADATSKSEEEQKKAAPDPDALVPHLESHNITYGDLQTAVRVLEAVSSTFSPPRHKKRKQNEETRDELLEKYKDSNLRPFRKALAPCIHLHQRTMFAGKSEEEFYARRIQERSLKRQKNAEREMQKRYIATTALRKGRVDRLQALKEDSKEEELAKMANLIPDGHVETVRLLENGTTKTVVEDASDSENGDAVDGSTGVRLPKLRSCYVCKVRYRELHHFYDQLCPPCAALNWEKRHQSANLMGCVAVVTGSRVKIGYQVCLKLLRAGCTVVATTRFPNSAVTTYRSEPDFEAWNDRLHVYGLDLRDISGLEAFTRFLKMHHPSGIDILVNNACQTVRRPAGYYIPLVEREQVLWKESDETHKSILNGCAEFEKLRRKILLDHKKLDMGKQLDRGAQMPLPMEMEPTDQKPPAESVAVSSLIQSSSAIKVEKNDETPFSIIGLSHSAAMSQMIILPEDAGVSDSILPPGVTDINGQQLDLRSHNSWLLKMEEVSTPEIMECMFINAIAPFVLNSRLKPLMSIPNDDSRPDRYIINVSAMEGKFYRYKMPNHPHTNMAKAALNMLTRTSAEDLAAKHRIFMNSVDTGWINDENPLERASRTAEKNLFQTPIDEIDAAARILDPVFTGVNAGKGKEKDFGKFLKDYHESEW